MPVERTRRDVGGTSQAVRNESAPFSGGVSTPRSGFLSMSPGAVRPGYLTPRTAGLHQQRRPSASTDHGIWYPRPQCAVEAQAVDLPEPSRLDSTSPLGPHPSPPPLWYDTRALAESSSTASFGASYFAGARGVKIKNSHINTSFGGSKTLFEHLEPHIAHGAAHDSNDRRDAPACHEETRKAIREDIVGWLRLGEGADGPRRVMWLSGPAGGGKSAIAGSVAEACKDEGLLAATFFFSSFSPSIDRSWSRGLIATLVHHLSQHRALRLFKQQLLEALEERPDIFHKSLVEQAKHLIIAPFCRICGQTEQLGWPTAIIIDGVDEVVAPPDLEPQRSTRRRQRTSEEDQVEVLGALLTLCQSPYFPFRIFIASRPEKHIADFFADVQPSPISLFLDSKYDPDADIRRFLSSKLAQIRRRSGISNVSWPGEGAVERIVDMSSGQFIVPTTVIRWIEQGLPQQQLDEVLSLARGSSTSRNPFASLDALYHHILTRARNPESDPRLVVKWIHCTSEGHQKYSKPAHFWRQMFEDVEGEFDYRMSPILSLVFIPPPGDHSSPISIYHKSLADYLASSTRSRDLYVDEREIASLKSERTLIALKGPPIIPVSTPKRVSQVANIS